MIPSFVTDPNPSLYITGRCIVLDFETTNIEKGTALSPNNHMVLACWMICEAGTIISRHYNWGSEYEQEALVSAIAGCDFIVAQNAKFELQWLDRCGYDVGSKPVYDTMLAEWVISGNRGWRLNLDAICTRLGIPNKSRLIKLLMMGGVSPVDMPRSWLLKYCAGDVMSTFLAMQAQLKEMVGTRLLPIVYTRCLTTLALSDIEKNGICLDAEEVEQEYETVLAEYAGLIQELDGLCGGINLNSKQQLGAYLYDTLQFKELVSPYGQHEVLRTASGLRKTDALTLAALIAETSEQEAFVALKSRQGKLGAALSKTLDFFIGVCREHDSIFFGELRQGTTRTHRLSSAGRPLKFKTQTKMKSCQFQNLANQYKRLIKARHPDWVVGEADGSQLEFRVGGHLGDDQQIKADVRNKADIHGYTAAALTAAGEPTGRRAAKASTFKPMYGGTKGTPAVEAYCKLFAEKYHGLNETQREWAYTAADRKWIETEWGMTYYFPKVKILQSGYVSGQQQVFNYPVQGLATAEIIPIGLVHFWYRVRHADMIITNTVHDSIIAEIPPYEIELFQLAAVQALTEDVYSYLDKCYDMKFSLPLGVSIKLGTHWGVSAFDDDQLNEIAQPMRQLGYDVTVKDEEISIDVPN